MGGKTVKIWKNSWKFVVIKKIRGNPIKSEKCCKNNLELKKIYEKIEMKVDRVLKKCRVNKKTAEKSV